MYGPLQRLPLALALALGLSPVIAWAPETRVRMVDEAIRFVPTSLRIAFESHRRDVLRGMLAPMAREDASGHRPPWSAGSLDDTLEREAHWLLETLAQPTPFDEVAERFGGVAHYVADAGFPPGTSRGDGASRYSHFARFCEERRERFALVFYGHDDEALAADDYCEFAVRVMQRAAVDDRELARAYAAAGDPPDPAAFDDRSVPFAVGSLAYSRSITNIVRIWLHIWNRANGDMGRTPYRAPSESRGG